MSGNLNNLQEKMDFLRQKPHVFEIITTHGGAKNMTDLKSLSGPALNRLQHYVNYYYDIVTSAS